MKSTLTTLFILSIILVSCNTKSNSFKVSQITIDGKASLSYEPSMALTDIRDSAFYYFTQEDLNRAHSATFKKGAIIKKTDYFKTMVMLREYNEQGFSQFEFILRNFSKDGKIIDSFEIGSTVNGKNCEGQFDGNKTITRSCGGKDETFLINDLGKFVKK